MKNKVFQVRQGDVLVEAIDEPIPKDAKLVEREAGRLILAHGEATGHAHAITGKGCKLFERGSMARMLEVTAKGGVEIRHEEHGAIALPPGNYRVTRKREWTGEDERQVMD
jgi:hypothetical protein